jgi:predicted transcriptional regulator
MTTHQILDNHFKFIWQSFAATYNALRLFSEQLPTIADRLDEQIIKEMAQVMAEVFDDSPEQLRAELYEFLPSLDNDNLYPDFLNQPDVRESFSAFQDTSFRRRVLKWTRENPLQSHRLLAAWSDYMAQPPMSGIVLRQSALINLVSTLEVFVDEILKIYMQQVDPANNLVEFHSWKKRWDKLSKAIPSPLWHIFREALEEIIARRNILIHKGGRIDSEYMRFAPASFRPPEAQENRLILVPTRYLETAFDTVLLFAFSLSQAAWRNWSEPKHSKQADITAHNFIYQVLRQRRFTLVEKLGEIAGKLKLRWYYRQYVLINQAIAQREMGNETGVDTLLAELEQGKKRLPAIEVSLNILHRRYEKAHELMKLAAKENKLNKFSPFWPLFDPVRDEAWFKQLFAVKHGELPKRM